MSYPVRVVVKETVRDVVSTKDSLTIRLANDPILRKQGAKERLEATLADSGWTASEDESSDVYTKRLDNGVDVSWDLSSNELTLSGSAETEVERSAQRELRGDSVTREGAAAQEDELRSRGRQQLQEQLARQLTDVKDDAERELLGRIHESLEDAHDQVAEEVNGMLEGVYREWLLEQAKGLGNVVSQHETQSADGDVYELTIRISQ